MIIDKVRPLRKDVLIKPKTVRTHTSTIIHVEESRKEKINFFEVVKVGPEVSEVSIGDVILLDFAHHTPHVEVDGEQYAIVEEKDIVAVLEN